MLSSLRRLAVASGLIEWEGERGRLTVGEPRAIRALGTLGALTFGAYALHGLMLLQLGVGAPIGPGVPDEGGATPTLTSVTREIGSKAGGDRVRLIGSSFQAGVTVTFGDTTMTVDSVSATADTAFVTTARRATAAGFDTVNVVACNGAVCDTIVGGFEFGDSITSTWASHSFEDSTSGAFSITGTAANNTYPTGVSVGGSRAHRGQWIGSGAGGSHPYFTFSSPSQPPLESTGMWTRRYQRITAASLVFVQSDQMKLELMRQDTGSNPPSWLHWGIGADFGGCGAGTDELGILTDYDTGCLSGGQSATGFVVSGDTWFEWLCWNYHDGATGRVRCWLDGLQVVDETDASFGTTNDALAIKWDFGLVYTEDNGVNDTLVAYVDDAVAANGVPIKVSN